MCGKHLRDASLRETLSSPIVAATPQVEQGEAYLRSLTAPWRGQNMNHGLPDS
jgi:hypothetical protein